MTADALRGCGADHTRGAARCAGAGVCLAPRDRRLSAWRGACRVADGEPPFVG